MTPEWEHAVRCGSIAKLDRLILEGADINARDRRNQTALMIASVGGDLPVVEWLLAHGAQVDHTAKYGLSALMLAATGGHADVVKTLVDAGADAALRGTGPPGFAGKTALDLASAQNDTRVIEVLQSPSAPDGTTRNPHFESAGSWEAARALVKFQPRIPSHTEGLELESLQIHVLDHKMREVPIEARTLEAHYGAFVLSQSQPGVGEARRQALEVSYGRAPGECSIHGHAGRVYQLGPEPEADDIDPRNPAVVVWNDGPMLYLVASDRMSSDTLMRIAASVYL